MSNNKFTIELGAGLTQMGDNDFPLMRAKDVDVNGETLLNYIPMILTQEEYNIIDSGGTIFINGQPVSFEENRIYMIKRYAEDDKSEEV